MHYILKKAESIGGEKIFPLLTVALWTVSIVSIVSSFLVLKTLRFRQISVSQKSILDKVRNNS